MNSALYPIPENAEATRLIFGRARRERAESGAMVLENPLSMMEREIVSRRLKQITPHLSSAKPSEARSLLGEVFPASGDKEATKRRAHDLASATTGLPIFVIHRAALSFKNEGKIPTAHELRVAAENIARPYWNEVSVGSLLLKAERAKRDAGPQAKAAVAAMLEDFKKKTADVAQKEIESERAERLAREQEAMRRSHEQLIAEYEQRGLKPVYADEQREIVVSLTTLLSLGWRIEEVSGAPCLLTAAGARA